MGRGGRSRRKRVVANAGTAAEHSPLDLSAGAESAAKRARLSVSPSTRSDSDERDRTSNDGKSSLSTSLGYNHYMNAHERRLNKLFNRNGGHHG